MPSLEKRKTPSLDRSVAELAIPVVVRGPVWRVQSSFRAGWCGDLQFAGVEAVIRRLADEPASGSDVFVFELAS